MGRHGGHEQDAPRSRGKREPEPDYRDEPIGRRLRPEESAVTEPRTGFLGSGWSAPSDLSDPVWPDEKRRSGRRIRTVLLAVAAVAVVLGGTVAGVQVMGSPAGSSADCPPGGCAAETPDGSESYPTGLTDPADQTGEPTPSGEPERAEKDKATPVPTPAVTRQQTGRTSAAPTPTPKATRAPRRTEPARPTRKPESEPSTTRESLITDTGRQDPTLTQPPVPQPSQTSVPETSDTPAAGGAAVTVGFGVVQEVVQEKEEVYTAKLTVTAGEKITGLALSLPVGGEVDSVTGAGWKQDGDTLVLEPGKDLEVGESLVLTFTARGRAQAPQTCRSTRGECAVV
ncbi:hypothetical protein [Streptosporangium roseum]|uniref:hypothetical protein n=1 Tax=Streptosporangium roseum TaxID=2001 RepID=UPI0004CD7788|nr:hypothetical protein [Streptosporangium roseum]